VTFFAVMRFYGLYLDPLCLISGCPSLDWCPVAIPNFVTSRASFGESSKLWSPACVLCRFHLFLLFLCSGLCPLADVYTIYHVIDVVKNLE